MFSFGERLGLLFTVQASMVTAVCDISILSYVAYKRMKRAWQNKLIAPHASDSSLFVNLIIGDLIQAIANLPSIRWISDAGVTEGPLCYAQAVLKQIGSNAVALTCLAITLQTFFILIFQWPIRKKFWKFVLLGIWIFIGLIIGIPYAVHSKEKYYGASNYWCWVLPAHRASQIMSEYLYMWVTAATMMILYGIMFLVLRGYIGMGFLSTESLENAEVKKVAKMLLFYPAVYVVCVVPLSFTRWRLYFGHDVPYRAALFASTLFAPTGLFNLILFSITRPALVFGTSPAAESATTPSSPHSKSRHYHHDQGSSRRVYRGKYEHLPNKSSTFASAWDVEQAPPRALSMRRAALSPGLVLEIGR